MMPFRGVIRTYTCKSGVIRKHLVALGLWGTVTGKGGGDAHSLCYWLGFSGRGPMPVTVPREEGCLHFTPEGQESSHKGKGLRNFSAESIWWEMLRNGIHRKREIQCKKKPSRKHSPKLSPG